MVFVGQTSPGKVPILFWLSAMSSTLTWTFEAFPPSLHSERYHKLNFLAKNRKKFFLANFDFLKFAFWLEFCRPQGFRFQEGL